MTKAIFFDFDDTLGNRKAYAYDCYRSLLQPYMTNMSAIEQEALLQHVMLFDEGGDCPKQMVQHRLQESYGIQLPYALQEEWGKMLGKYTVLFEDTMDTLEYLKQKYLLGVITNGPSQEQRQKLAQVQLLSYFDVIVVSGDYPYRKPDVRLFQTACQLVHQEPKECVFVGDLFHRDILGAMRAGMDAVWISEEDKKCLYPCKRITKLSQLKNLY